MARPNPAAQYQHMQILTASPQQLVLLTVQGLRRAVQRALMLAEREDWQAYGEQISKAQDCLLELTVSLNPEADQEMVSRMAGLYDYLEQQLVKANVSRQTDSLPATLDVVKELESAWSELCSQQN